MNMDRSQVMAALEAVNAVLKAKGQKATVVITGGAAIMFQFPDFPREVKDLDGGYMSPELQVAVEQVTWEMDLADGWFNDTSKDYYAPKKGQTVPGPQFSNLSIQLPSKEYLLCLKIMSGRPEEKANDPVDVGFMVMHMPEIKSEKDWQDMYIKFFGKNDWKPYTAEAARRAIEARGGKTSGLKTEKGTPIKRSRLGVGKDIGGAIYLHKDYSSFLPDQTGLRKAEKIALTNGMKDYNVIKASKDGTYTFVKSLDFDTADEPTVGTYLTVKPDGSFKNGYSNAIWHHKWLWVMDDYAGFDVAESKERSRKWLSLPGVDFNRIGNKEYWNTNVVPKIGKVAKAPYKLQEFEGFQILIGRSAIENDVLSLEVANPNDFWFHVAGVPGSHIVVRNPDNLKELPGPVLQQVKQLAIHNSKARGTSAEVHWGFAKDVSKPKGAADGEVNLANWKKV